VLAELPLVRDRLGRMAGQLYGLESMLYLTTGLADCGADTEVESVVVRQFANQVADTVMSGCLDLFASRASLQSSPLQQAARDCAALQAWLGTPNINKCFVGVTLMQHLAAAKPELARIRQPANGNILESIRFQARWGRHRLGLYRSPHTSRSWPGSASPLTATSWRASGSRPGGADTGSASTAVLTSFPPLCPRGFRCRRGGWSGAP